MDFFIDVFPRLFLNIVSSPAEVGVSVVARRKRRICPDVWYIVSEQRNEFIISYLLMQTDLFLVLL